MRITDWDRPCSKCKKSTDVKFDTRITKSGTRVRQSWCRDCKKAISKQRSVTDRLKRETSARKKELYSILWALQKLTKRVGRLIDSCEDDIV